MKLAKEGYVNINGVNIYYKIFGNYEKYILILHGGPGASHDYLLPLARLSNEGFTTVFYDQCGSGRSEEHEDLEECTTLDYYVNEVEMVRKSIIGEKDFVLLGHSWGGLLALAYASRHQANLRGLIISSGLSSVPLTTKEMRRLIKELPSEIKAKIIECEEKNDFTSEECQAVAYEFYKRHLLRLDSYPKDVVESLNYLVKRKIYSIMNGPTEFEIRGKIKDIDITNDIKNIKVPTLITVGEYDEVTPSIAKIIKDNIEGSKMVVIPNSSHMAFYENPDYYFKVLIDFLGEIY